MRLRNGGMISESEYKNKPLNEAIQYAEQGGFTTRVIEKDGVSFMMTLDYRSDRVNFRVLDGIVIGASGG